MKKLVKYLVLPVLAIGLAVYAFREPLTLRLVDQIAGERMKAPFEPMADGLHIGLCGTGSPFPDPQRSGPCTLVTTGSQTLLFDVGGGAARQITAMNLSSGNINHVFLTHFHSDHIDGLGELLMTRWAQQTSGVRLTIHGPQGVDSVVDGLQKAYSMDHGYRTAHHSPQIMPPELAGAMAESFEVTGEEIKTVYLQDGLKVEAFKVSHPPVTPAVGYRVTYKGRSVVISGDTQKTATVAQAASGADLLIHEALHPGLVKELENTAAKWGRNKLSKIFSDIPDYHTSPAEVAKLASEANVKNVVLTHIVPPLPVPTMREIFLEGTHEAYSGPLRIGEDGDWISLLPNSEDVLYGRRWSR